MRILLGGVSRENRAIMATLILVAMVITVAVAVAFWVGSMLR